MNSADNLRAIAERRALGLGYEDAAKLKLAAVEIERLTKERDEARLLVTEANNSLYGSQGYFHSMNGGPFDKYHLAKGIEQLKSHGRTEYSRAETAERLLPASTGALVKNKPLRPRLKPPRNGFSHRLIREFYTIHAASGRTDKSVELDAGVARNIIGQLRHSRTRTATVETLEALLNAHGYTLKIVPTTERTE